jgi:hypothetical protein
MKAFFGVAWPSMGGRGCYIYVLLVPLCNMDMSELYFVIVCRLCYGVLLLYRFHICYYICTLFLALLL